MVPSFGRSISFPLSPARSKPRTPAYHVRSISLPCRSHPLLSHLQSEIRAVRAWISEPMSVSSGLAHIDALHAVLGDLLLLPEARAALRGAAAADCLLDGSLVLADAHGCFQETVQALKQHVAEALCALRRHDAARVSSAVRSQRHAEKELARLASAVRGAAKCPQVGAATNAAEVEMAGVLTEAVAAVASASAAVFLAVTSMSAAATTATASSCKKTGALVALVKKKASSEEKEMVALERLEELEESIGELENGSEKAFRNIVQTRVSLLNIHTQTY